MIYELFVNTSLEEVVFNPPRGRIRDGNIVYPLFSIDGVLKQSVRVNGSQVDIPLHKDNVYVVKVGAKTVKLRL